MTIKTEKPLVLLCNDDGILAPGIKALGKKLSEGGVDVWMVAPLTERSASAMSLSIGRPLRLQKIDHQAYAVHGSPVDCIFMALGEILPRQPDWVFSGINRGGNLGQDTLYSGTVAAAIEAALRGIRSVAVSLEPLFGQPLDEHNPILFEDAAEVMWQLFQRRENWAPEPGFVMNINIPSLKYAEIRGLKKAHLGRRVYDRQMQRKVDPRGNNYFWVGGGGQFEAIENSDCQLVHSGYVTMSILKPCYYHDNLTQSLDISSLDGVFENKHL